MDERIEELLAYAELYFETRKAMGAFWWVCRN